jgi:hypothetical protein
MAINEKFTSLYVTDFGNNAIRSVNLSSSTYSVATIISNVSSPWGIALDSSNLYFSSSLDCVLYKLVLSSLSLVVLAGSIGELSFERYIQLILILGTSGFIDGSLSAVRFYSPSYIYFNSRKDVLYVADNRVNYPSVVTSVVRKVSLPFGVVSTIAGASTFAIIFKYELFYGNCCAACRSTPCYVDNVLGQNAFFNSIGNIYIPPNSAAIYISDENNGRVRMLSCLSSYGNNHILYFFFANNETRV